MILLLPLLAALAGAAAATRPNLDCFNVTARPQGGQVRGEHIDIHVIAHTHDDVGWLETVDEYYVDQVRWILDTSIEALRENPQRKFSYVEIAYFERWWGEADNSTKALVRQLVQEGRLDFNLGGWCMNDEAAAFYTQEIDQMTEGAQFLLREVNATPAVGWHIDPFGHSSASPSMWAQMGLSAFGMQRIDYRLKQTLGSEQELEFVWRPSASLGSANDMFVHIMPAGYCTPGELGYDGGLAINEDASLPTYGTNYIQQAEAFVGMARGRATLFKHSHVLIPFGCDFAHQNAHHDFKQLDQLINYINSNSSLNATVKYSTFAEYIGAVHSEDIAWNVWGPDQGDFFPYIDQPHAYWTGYYTSRPQLKGLIRQAGDTLRHAEQLYLAAQLRGLASPSGALDQDLDFMRQVQGVTQHHDAVTGTEKQHVADDYALQLSMGTQRTQQLTAGLAGELFQTTANSSLARAAAPPPLFTFDGSEPLQSLAAGKVLPVSVHNSLGWTRTQVVHVPCNRSDLVVLDAGGKPVPSQINPHPAMLQGRGGVYANYTLFFLASAIPPLTTTVFFVAVDAASATQGAVHTVAPGESATISSNTYKVLFSNTTGRLETLVNLQSGVAKRLGHSFNQYYSAAQSEKNSGAYVFRPEQGSRLAVGSDDRAGQEYVRSSWSWVGPSPQSPRVFLTPVADAQYNDTFAMIVRARDNSSFAICTSRADGEGSASDPWGQSPVANFLALDAAAGSEPLLPGFILSQVDVGSSLAQGWKSAFAPFAKPFANIPRLQVTVSGTSDTDETYAVVVSNVTAAGFTYNITRRGHIGQWGQDLKLNVLAWLPSVPLPANGTFAQGSVSASLSAGVEVARVQFNLTPAGSPPLLVGDPIILLTAEVADLRLPLAVTVTSPSTANIACLDGCKIPPNSQITLHFLAFQRTTFQEPVQVPTTVVTGLLVSEAWQTFKEEYAGQVVRVYSTKAVDADLAAVEVVNVVGPLTAGREFVTRFETNLATAINATAGELYTEDNGLVMVRRVWSSLRDEPVSGNYYPVSKRALLRDRKDNTTLALVTTRAHGCGANAEGHVELMLHRRCLKDDGYGVGEVLDEQDRVFPSLWLVLDSPEACAATHRRLGVTSEYPLQIMFAANATASAQAWNASYATSISDMSRDLPPNLHLLSLSRRKDSNDAILRFQHLFPVGEHPTLSQPATVDLASLFTKIAMSNIPPETSLSANQPLPLHRLSWKTNGEPVPQTPNPHSVHDNGTVIVLGPRELRTFLVPLPGKTA